MTKPETQTHPHSPTPVPTLTERHVKSAATRVNTDWYMHRPSYCGERDKIRPAR
jgi:hypothetical protein